jgi:serine/threonine protein kinase
LRPESKSIEIDSEQGAGVFAKFGLAAGHAPQGCQEVLPEFPPRPGEIVGDLGHGKSEFGTQFFVGWAAMGPGQIQSLKHLCLDKFVGRLASLSKGVHGRPVLVDFGLTVRFSGALSREALDVAASAGGTVPYMAPEQLRGLHDQVDDKQNTPQQLILKLQELFNEAL